MCRGPRQLDHPSVRRPVYNAALTTPTATPSSTARQLAPAAETAPRASAPCLPQPVALARADEREADARWWGGDDSSQLVVPAPRWEQRGLRQLGCGRGSSESHEAA